MKNRYITIKELEHLALVTLNNQAIFDIAICYRNGGIKLTNDLPIATDKNVLVIVTNIF